MEYARAIGKDFGMPAREVNKILLKQGVLDGRPGNYRLTEKGRDLGVEVVHTAQGKEFVLRKFDSEVRQIIADQIEAEETGLKPDEVSRIAPAWGAHAKQVGGIAALALIDALTPHLQEYVELQGRKVAERIINRKSI